MSNSERQNTQHSQEGVDVGATLNPAEYRMSSTATFGTGLLTGAAVSSVLPWHSFEPLSPVLRVGILACICATFVLFRLALRRRHVKRMAGLLSVIAGGFLMSSGQHLESFTSTTAFTAAGAAAFLCGITLLLRDRLPTRTEREEAIQRLIDADPEGSSGRLQASLQAHGSNSTEPYVVSVPVERPTNDDETRWIRNLVSLSAHVENGRGLPYSANVRSDRKDYSYERPDQS